MGLFRRLQQPSPSAPPQLPGYHSLLEANGQKAFGAGAGIAKQAWWRAYSAYDDVSKNGGSLEDLQSIVDSLTGLGRIAAKLCEIDAVLRDASNGSMPVWSGPAQSATLDSVKLAAERQTKALEQWADGFDGVKGQWYQQMLAVRSEVVSRLVEGYGHMARLDDDIAFRHAAAKSQAILPEFAVQDADSELLTTENAAMKASALAEAVAALDLPKLEPLAELASPADVGSEAAPELSR